MRPQGITYVMPTRNRPQFLRRALAYYAGQQCAATFIVSDSSDPARKPAVHDAAAVDGLDVVVRDFDPSITINGKIIESLRGVTTPYTVIAGDDDFMVPATVAQAAGYLEAHPDFSVAHGGAFTFVVGGAGVHGAVETMRPYRQRSLLDDDPVRRLRSHFHDWSTTFYSVHRTATVVDLFSAFPRLAEDNSAFEVYFYAANALRGKEVSLPVPYMYRQVEIAKEYAFHDTHVWAEAPGWPGLRQALIAEIGRELAAASRRERGWCDALAAALLDRWVDSRRPFALRRWRDYPMRYYVERGFNLGHKAGFRCREYVWPSAAGRAMRAALAGAQ